jgi:hypothetical protein
MQILSDEMSAVPDGEWSHRALAAVEHLELHAFRAAWDP